MADEEDAARPPRYPRAGPLTGEPPDWQAFNDPEAWQITWSLILGFTLSAVVQAVALARALVRRGAGFVAAMAFEIASTNLVIELGIILALLVGWQFTLAEFIGRPIMIVLMAVAFRLFVRQRLIEAARQQADRAWPGRWKATPRWT